MQVVYTQVADGIRRIAVQVNQCLKAVLLATVKQPVDRTLTGASDRVSLAVILEEVVQEVIADDLPAGAANVNKAVRDALPKLLEDFQVVHLCGKDKIDNLLLNTPGYKQFEYIKAELKDIFAMADIVISRAGANAICELLALKKPNILIPLPAASSRGDQLLNAASFEAQGYSIVLNEDDITTNLLVDKVHELYFNRQNYVEAMSRSHQMDAVKTIMELINAAAEK